MEITRESLQQRYSDLADAELLRRARSGALTELAHEVALDELAQRGISPDAIGRSAPAPTVDAELEFSPDEFDRNPYQAPRAPDSVRSASPPAPQSAGRWNALWWIYIGYLCLMVIVGLVQAAIRDTMPAIDVAYVVIYGLGAVGLAAWRLRRALFHPSVWVVCLAAGLALLSSGVKGLVAILNATDAPSQHNPLVYLAITLAVLNLALFWGLARYAFLSPSIWRRPALPQRTD
ncbi:hypothetical protein [Tahibacter sp.]|uniref:hypothetical protein n=1 Tax=Tahibacter sp. TaxID=2056211 RepID=UPI0028C37DB2|nr:hypothetical protein [Tahibacter sp.]